jgi:nitrate reductase (cytochrome), electron transfer subunit
MKKMIQLLVAGCLVSLFSLSVNAGVVSLRGDNPLDKGEKSFDKKKELTNKGGFERNYKKQPPLIPHTTEKDEITLRGNTCMRCHSKENFEKEKAPKIGDSHFIDRDGKVLEKVSMRRYFCTQCHVPQLDASPLVENTF